MGEIVEGLAIAAEPCLLIGHQPLEKGDRRHDREIDDVEPQEMRRRLEGEIGADQSAAENAGPDQVGDDLAEMRDAGVRHGQAFNQHLKYRMRRQWLSLSA
ncbi:hypothetical protein N7E02_09755 [Aliirhizobium terrae]|nr:hypothetical protein [Rhizobium sp. CC-CFT758]WJH42387.1 hypothetical protein N7E02_09755 [Rhizobium sp. CC-CFT758]